MQSILGFLTTSWNAVGQTAMGLLYPALFFLVLAFAVKGPSFIQDIRRALPQSSLNIQIIAFNVILVTPFLVLAVVGFHSILMDAGWIFVSPAVWENLPNVVTIFIAIFIGDFVGYWRHRMEHSPLFWPAHAVHHSDTEMTWLSLERFHPLNLVTTFFIDATALVVLGLPPYAIIANNLVRHYYGYFIHADLPWTYGPLGKIFVSPAMHRWHHAADMRAFNTNYATVFSVFDAAFGTKRVPGPCDVPLGVTDDMAPTLAGQMLYAFKPRAYKRLWRRLKGAGK